MGTKFDGLADAVTIQDTDLFAISRSPHTAGMSRKAVATYLTTYLNAKIQLASPNQITNLYGSSGVVTVNTGAATTYTLTYPLASRYVFVPNAGVGLVVTLPAYDATRVTLGQPLEIRCTGGAGCGITFQDYQGNPIVPAGIGTGDSWVGRIGVNTVDVIRLGTAAYYEKADFEDPANKDASNGYVGKSAGKMNFYNVLGTLQSLIYNTNVSTPKTYFFQDRSGTIADDTDLAGKQSTSAKDASGGYAGLTLFKINFKNALNTFISFLTNANTAARTYTFQDRDGTIADNTDLATKQNITRAIRVVTGNTGTFTSADRGNIVSCTSASPITFTLPDSVSEPLIVVGDTFDLIQDGTGIITLQSTSGSIWINAPIGPGPITTNGQYSKLTLVRVTGGWKLSQDAAQTFVFTQRTQNLADLQSIPSALANLGVTGKHAWPISLGSMYPSLTSGASAVQVESTTNKNNARGWSFAASGNNYLHFRIPLPKSWNQSTFSYQIDWNTTGTSGNVVWSVQAVIRNNGSAEDLAFGTAITVTSAANASASANIIASESGALTAAGTAANNSFIEFRINRNGGSGSDTLAAAAVLLGFTLFLTTNAGNDA